VVITHPRLATPSPVPRRLVRAPSRATLSPKGERVRCHSESFAVILSEAKNLDLPAQDKLREESRSAHSPLPAM
jgi:hypothetical protein